MSSAGPGAGAGAGIDGGTVEGSASDVNGPKRLGASGAGITKSLSQ